MSGYGRDESAPTPGGMFATNFVGERNIINNLSAALSQTVSSVIANHQQHYGNPQAAVGADSSCPHIRIRNAFAIRLKCLHGTFATYSFSVCYIFTMQKYGFCATKVWFLACKNPLFTLQKPPFWRARSGFLQSLN